MLYVFVYLPIDITDSKNIKNLIPMKIKDLIQLKFDTFQTICKNHNVTYLYAFGSSTNDNFDETTSDIDFLIEVDEQDPIAKGEKLLSVWDTFESFFNRKVDLLTQNTIKNPILNKNIEKTKVLVYERKTYHR